MARIVGIDYGTKKTGISATDNLQIIVSAIDTVPTGELLTFLQKYMTEEEVEKIVFGKPTHKDGNPTYLQDHIESQKHNSSEWYSQVKEKGQNLSRQDKCGANLTEVFATHIV